jgi:excinuclease ABC subunit C
VPGIGARRKKALLQYFGSAKAVAEAAPRELQQVEGISAKMAQAIHDFFHDEDAA